MVDVVDVELSLDEPKNEETRVTFLTPDDEYTVSWTRPPNDTPVGTRDARRYRQRVGAGLLVRRPATGAG